ncbi:MAG: EamA family transporter [Melioribacteraceae bacterium]|nr:EamA family transporter [Melioribacteraceae bacterium]
MFSEKAKITLGFILICLIWGSTWLAICLGLESLTPIISAGIRFTLASIFVYVMMRIKKINLQNDQLSIKLYLVLAFFSFVIPFGLVYWAEQFIPSGLASIIFAVMPFGVLIFSRLAIPETKISFYQVAGVLLGFAGIITIFSEDISIDISNNFLGMVAVLLSATMQAGIAVTIKKYGSNLNPLSMNFVPLLIAGIVMTIYSFIFENITYWSFDLNAIGSITYLAFFGTMVTFTTYYWLLKRMNIVILSLSTFITPIVAVLLGWIVLNEKFTMQALAGSTMVLIGILFANFRGLFNYYQLTKKKFKS